MKILLNSTKHIDIFGLCETFLSESVDNDILNLDGYTFERKDRHEINTASANKGGGVLIYLSNNLNYIRRKDIESPDIESIWVEIMLRNSKSFLVCSVYKPPSSAVERYEMFSKQIEKSMGDINVDVKNAVLTNKTWKNTVELHDLQQLMYNGSNKGNRSLRNYN